METLAELLEEGEKSWECTTSFDIGEHSIDVWMKRL
jgi:hypothetical protein